MSVKLITDLNFAGKINEANAVTEAGKELIKNYKGYLFTNPTTCSLVNGFVREAQKYTFDAELVKVCESVLSFINENKISWKLATACESINNNGSSYNYIAQTGVEKVEKVLEGRDEKDVVAFIKAGGLKGVQYIPEFRAVCKEVYKSTIVETVTPNYKITNPVSFVYEAVDTEGIRYFNVLGKTYKHANNEIVEAVCDDVTFKRINMLLEAFTNVEGKLVYETKLGFNTYNFAIYEEDEKSKLAFTCGNTKEVFESVQNYNEFCDTYSRALQMNEMLQFMNIARAISEVFEVSNKIMALDNVKIVESANGSLSAILEADNNVTLTVFKSVNYGAYNKSYDYVAEALKELTKVSGIDLKSMYEDRINEDVKKANPEEYNNIQEELKASKEAQMDLRKKKIAQLAEANKNNPAILSVLNKMAADLKLLDA